MRANSMVLSALASLALLAAPAIAQPGAYFVMGTGAPIVLERIDPVMSPGQVANHVHSVVGGNGFAATMDFAQTQTSTCATVPVVPDKSNYWMPNLYFHASNGSFIRVPEQPYHKIYYKYGNNDDTPDLTRSEFPQEFRMITGNAELRENDGSMGTPGNQLQWECHGTGAPAATTGFPTGFTSCSDGLAAAMRFPSCWDGQAFNPANASAHMAFPTNADGLAGCVAPYNVARFPEIFIEYWFTIDTFNGLYSASDNPWVLSQGDPTGYGFHMDFVSKNPPPIPPSQLVSRIHKTHQLITPSPPQINGWETGILKQAMATCNCGNTCTNSLTAPSENTLAATTCFGPSGVRQQDAMNACQLAPIVDENVGWTPGTLDNTEGGPQTYGGVLAALPGCNPIQAGPQLATIQTGCGATTSLVPGAAGNSTAADNGTSATASSAASLPSSMRMKIRGHRRAAHRFLATS
ncbi:hypothetical protein MMC08_004661 [Hypocenomyce scalaris]|nr:hypothetical protein [Hypocenomyce scalaris]